MVAKPEMTLRMRLTHLQTILIGRDVSRLTDIMLFECFPGGKQRLDKIINKKTNEYFFSSNVISAIEFIIKNNILIKEQLINWRNELYKLPNAENNKGVSNAIGVMTLYSNEIKHIAYVADGNRRWANKQGLMVDKAHEHAFVNTIPSVTEHIFKFGVHTFSIWQFKEKNLFTRTKQEVIESILKYLINALEIYLEMAKKLNIRIYHIGNKHCSHPDPDIQYHFNRLMKMFDIVESKTSHFTKHHLIIGANYEREDDLLRAFKKIHSQKINLDELKPEDIIKFTDMGSQLYPYPDLFIRSAMPYGGGRIGGFFPVTSEACVYFTPTLAPELTIKDIAGAAKFADPLIRYKSAEHFNKNDTIPKSIRARL